MFADNRHRRATGAIVGAKCSGSRRNGAGGTGPVVRAPLRCSSLGCATPQCMGIRVFVADDHAVLRAGVALMLDLEADIEVVGQAASAEAAVRGCVETQPTVALIDLSMPGGGLEAIIQLRTVCSNIRCVALTMHDDAAYMRAVLDAGGVGFLTKAAAAEELVAAVRQVSSGTVYIKLSVSDGKPERGPGPMLSQREREVLVLVARGFGNREIADLIGVTRKTVDTYRARVQDKLGFACRSELVDYALRAGLLAPEPER